MSAPAIEVEPTRRDLLDALEGLLVMLERLSLSLTRDTEASRADA